MHKRSVTKITDLKYVIEAAEARSISAVAKNLYVAQPNVSIKRFSSFLLGSSIKAVLNGMAGLKNEIGHAVCNRTETIYVYQHSLCYLIYKL